MGYFCMDNLYRDTAFLLVSHQKVQALKQPPGLTHMRILD